MLQKGDLFPNFTYVSYDGSTKNLYAETGSNPSVILFLRYIGCTKCRLDVHELLASQKQIQQKGIRLFVVFQSEAARVRQEVQAVPFEIICDPGQELYRRFGVTAASSTEELLDLKHFAEEHQKFQKAKEALGVAHGVYEGNELQKPAIFVLNEEKKIIFVHYARSLMDMPLAAKWIGMFPDRSEGGS